MSALTSWSLLPKEARSKADRAVGGRPGGGRTEDIRLDSP